MVKFNYTKPNSAQKYQCIKAAHLEFDKPNCSLFFSKQFLDKPLASADHFSFQRAILNCQKELNSYLQQNLNIEDRVSKLLRQDDGVALSLDDIAENLHISKRSLHRFLKKEGPSFKLLLQKIKADQAMMLFQQGKTVTEVAFLLDYSDCANFRRAFKTWFGVAPKEWILKNRITNATK